MASAEQEDGQAESAMGVELYREYWGRGEEIRAYKDAEQEHNRKKFGQTYREVTGPEHKMCIVLCLDPGQRKPVRCPVCYGKAGFRPMDEMPGIEPLPTRGERLSAWAGACLAAFWEGLTFPFMASREHRTALVRDIIQDALEAGLRAEVVQTCPVCEKAETS